MCSLGHRVEHSSDKGTTAIGLNDLDDETLAGAKRVRTARCHESDPPPSSGEIASRFDSETSHTVRQSAGRRMLDVAGFPSARNEHLDRRGETHVSIDEVRADAATIRAAAAHLRSAMIRDQHRGRVHPARGFAAALLLDELALHVRDLDDELRRRMVEVCRTLA